MDMEKRLPDEQDKGQHNMKSEMVSPMPNKEPTMQSTQNWEVEFEELTKYCDTTNTTVERIKLKSFIRSIEEKAMEEGYIKGIDKALWEVKEAVLPEMDSYRCLHCLGHNKIIRIWKTKRV